MDYVYKLHGMPGHIVLDRDKVFLSAFWQELFTKLGIKLHFSTSYHPQSDGQTERVNQCSENYLRCMIALKQTPFEALYGYKPPVLAMSNYLREVDSGAEVLLQDRAKMIQLIKENLLQAQNRIKIMADKKRIERTFQEGEHVYLKLQPYRQNFVSLRKHLKLAPKYYGPFKILNKIGEVAYKLDLPPSSKIHPVFHVSLLKKHIKRKDVPMEVLPEILHDRSFPITPITILGKRTIQRGRIYVFQVLIQWNHSTPDEATWEDYHFIWKRILAFLGVKEGVRGRNCHEKEGPQVNDDEESNSKPIVVPQMKKM
ncbi:hypothetical protein LIER_35581 [Lithospermum erythrorhizon]|uniref:Integrase catalytic domain-containing protein n=1 Tax=Lithospermum erythrorhizon TaxID=34254 RepID=A0AAV3NH83_LITER